MLEMIEYLEEADGLSIYRCYGSGAYADLPGRLRGRKVVSLKDHCFAPEASVRVDRSRLKTILRSEWMDDCDGTAPAYERDASAEPERFEPICGGALHEIDLPGTLKRTEGYVFYGCRNLRRIRFPGTFQTLGGGNFVDCNHLETVEFELSGPEEETIRETERENPVPGGASGALAFETPVCMKDILGEVTYEVKARVTDHGKTVLELLFPGYYEDSEENTPARIIAVKYEGMGYKYRQCFKNGRLDFDAYDSLFYFTSVQELPRTVLLLALCRMRYSEGMSEKAGKNYLNYLRTCPKELMEELIGRDDADTLKKLLEASFFDAQTLSFCIDLAAGKNAGQMVSMMMDYRRAHFASERKRYTF